MAAAESRKSWISDLDQSLIRVHSTNESKYRDPNHLAQIAAGTEPPLIPPAAIAFIRAAIANGRFSIATFADPSDQKGAPEDYDGVFGGKNYVIRLLQVHGLTDTEVSQIQIEAYRYESRKRLSDKMKHLMGIVAAGQENDQHIFFDDDKFNVEKPSMPEGFTGVHVPFQYENAPAVLEKFWRSQLATYFPEVAAALPPAAGFWAIPLPTSPDEEVSSDDRRGSRTASFGSATSGSGLSVLSTLEPGTGGGASCTAAHPSLQSVFLCPPESKSADTDSALKPNSLDLLAVDPSAVLDF